MTTFCTGRRTSRRQSRRRAVGYPELATERITMARDRRSTKARSIHHVTTRGNNRQEIFLDDLDRVIFLEWIARAVDRWDWGLLAYCLMDNHIHLVVEAAPGDLSSGCRDAIGSYARRFNQRHETSGHLFGSRFNSVEVIDDRQLTAVLRYVALNPVTAGRVASPADWPWSSHRAAVGDHPPPLFLDVARLWSLLGRDDEVAQLYLRAVIAAQ